MARPLLAAALGLLLAGCGSSGPATPDEAVAEEGVNVGYGTLPELRVTGAVARLDQDDITESSVARLGDLIAGPFAGVDVRRTPGGGFRVIIRGTSTLNGSDEPLYVVDGVETIGIPGQGLPDLNPADVASIEVLKDAGAAAIYGSRGANGVVLITTKRRLD